MALSPKLTDLSGLPEGVAEFYSQNSEGTFELNVEGMVPKEQLDSFRANNLKLKQENDAITKAAQSIDIEEYKALKAKEQAQADQQLIEAGKVDELVMARTERLRTDLEAQMKQFQTQANEAVERAAKAESERDSYLINTKLQQAAVSAGVRDTAIPDVLNRAKQVWRIDPETKKPLPMHGDQIMYGKKGNGAMSMDEWFSITEEEAPHLFKSSSGGGAAGGVGPSGRRVSISDQEGLGYNLEGIASGKVQVISE